MICVYRSKIKYLVMVVALFLPTSVFATPSITSAPSTVAHGQSMIINGSDFRSKTTPAPALWDNVDNQTSYSGLSNGATIPVGGSNPWRVNVDGATKLRTIASEQRGVSTASYYASRSTKNALGTHPVSGANYLYISWWFKTDTSVSVSNHSSKFLRVSDYDDIVNRTFSWTQMQAYVWQSPSYYGNTWRTTAPSINNWHFMEAIFDSVNRTYSLMVDGVAIYDAISWSGATSTVFDDVDCIGYDGGGSAPPAITSWMDDIYVDNTPARVMVCTGNSWSSKGQCEMQTPTSWSNDTIGVTVNQGAFVNGSSGYLYVINASGEVSSGKQVFFGSGTVLSTPSVSITAITK